MYADFSQARDKNKFRSSFLVDDINPKPFSKQQRWIYCSSSSESGVTPPNTAEVC